MLIPYVFDLLSPLLFSIVLPGQLFILLVHSYQSREVVLRREGREGRGGERGEGQMERGLGQSNVQLEGGGEVELKGCEEKYL